MSTPVSPSPPPEDPAPAGSTPTGRERRRVVVATVVGTAVEWYDFFVYAAAAGLVFGQLFFAPAGEGFAQVLAFATVGISFLFRPFGAFLAGHLGDRYGRRLVLMLTLVLMGVATTLVGLLPTYSAIGVAAPVLLVLLRVVQGVSAGGEWGGAVLLAVEHAPTSRRGLLGAAPQTGVPLGLLLASGTLALMAVIAPGEAFLEWGWRVPFLLSFVLIVIGHQVRRRVDESPVFAELAERRERTRMPIVTLFRRHTPLVVIAALVFAGNNAVGYMTTGGYIQRYATDPDGPVRLAPAQVLGAVTLSAVTWLLFTVVGGWVCDRIGRRTTYAVGWVLLLAGVVTLFPLVNSGSVVLLTLGLAGLSVGLGLTYGPQAALYAELFPASVRFSGVSISYAVGAILGGAFAPTIAQAIVSTTGSTTGVTWYLAGMTVLGLASTLLLVDRPGIPLGPDHEAQQSLSPVRGLA